MTDFISNIFSAIFRPVLELIANLLPRIDPGNLPFSNAMSSILNTGYQLGFIIPWQAIFISLAVIASMELIILIIKFVMWIIRLARG